MGKKKALWEAASDEASGEIWLKHSEDAVEAGFIIVKLPLKIGKFGIK